MKGLTDTIGARIALMLTGAMPLSLKREEGQGLVEYALILSLIAILLIVSLTFLQGKIEDVFSKIGNAIPG